MNEENKEQKIDYKPRCAALARSRQRWKTQAGKLEAVAMDKYGQYAHMENNLRELYVAISKVENNHADPNGTDEQLVEALEELYAVRAKQLKERQS